MQDWLKSIGLESRIQAFSDNRITEEQIDDLTEQDLRELGLTIGERKVFLRERAKLARERASRSTSAQTMQAERRPLTIMFVDLVDSTVLGEALDAEDLVETMRRYREFAAQAINRFGGRIARFIGDGILAYFCYPVANENDPERAIRAALAITRGIGAVPTLSPEPLQVRLGLATGRVLIQRLFAGGAAAEEDAVLGSVPNLAARLQTLAGPNGIVISEQTYARVRGRFAARSLGPQVLHGFDHSHEPWLIEIEIADRNAFDSTRPLTSFTGRERELELLRSCWRKCVRGEDSVVVVTGEPGIGKSRLVREACRLEIGPADRMLPFASSAFEEDRPLGPFIDYLIERASLKRTEGAEATLARLDALLGADMLEANAAALLATLVGIDPGNVDVATLHPEQLRQRTISVLVEHLLRLNNVTPLCLMFEDVHWLDPTSRDLLRTLQVQMRGRRVMLLLTARGWSEATDMRLTLKPLLPDQVGAMIRDLSDVTALGVQAMAHIIRRSDGIPLYVEEIAGLLAQRGPHTSGSDPQVLRLEKEIPASLDELLTASLDRAGPAKELAQVASILGDDFQRPLLDALAGFDPVRFQDLLDGLLRLNILEPVAGFASDDVFHFRHAMLRDSAYVSIDRDRRRALHSRAAKLLEQLEPDMATTNPELLAYHLVEGTQPIEAAPFWLQAARQSLARSALTEASRILRRGLDLLETLPATPAIIGQRLQFAALLGPALISLRGPNATETQDLYTKAYELGHLLPEEPAHFPIYWGWWRLDTSSEERALALLERAKGRADPGLLLQAHHCCWGTYLNRAELGLCCEHVDAGFAIYEQGNYRQHARLYGNHDAKACAHLILAQALWLQGKLCSALEQERLGLEWADDMDHLGTHVHTRGMALLHRTYRRDYQVVLEQADELIALTSRHGMESAGAAALIFRGWAVAQLGDPDGGLMELEEGWARQREIATNEDYPVYLCLLAEILTALGRAPEAKARLYRELDSLERSQIRVWMPELERVLGDTILAVDPADADEARRHYIRAYDLAEFQKVPMLGLRVAMSAGRLQAGSASDQAAHLMSSAMAKLPQEAYDDGGLDLQDARAFVQELAESNGADPR